jgi:hypothetical protein
MKLLQNTFKAAAVLISAFSLFTGCGTTDEGGSSVSGSMYYGTGFYDPWYYGGDYYPPDAVGAPPPARPEAPVHPSQPIYRPSGPTATPMPSIPSTPRVSRRR